ncbi:nematode resistance protein-like HSPRO1 [Iris pallida]|uniref:Nematode resistance protein-like HSPRO1 n=1 Tax=Iris pallida TaxID=29817 RepID=A0AAX6GDQ5_IRIPA|nr:nematode resistance protein-like HSPRO1 [Iris pallida]
MNTNTPIFRSSYEHPLPLPELSDDRRTAAKDFPEWKGEPTIKPALQALEITFRLASHVLSDPRPYSVDAREWNRRLASLCSRQMEILSLLFEQTENVTGIPVAGLGSPSRASEASLLPRLAARDRTSCLARQVSLQIESLLHMCRFTLGLGEPNRAGKPSLEYDLIVRPTSLHAFEGRCRHRNRDADVLFTIRHVSESWSCACNGLLGEIVAKIQRGDWEQAASDCWILERIWKLLSEIEDLHMMMDPDDFLQLKTQLASPSSSSASNSPFRFVSAALLEVASMSKNLKNNVPKILAVEVDPKGGPRVQEAAMRLFHSSGRGEGDNPGRLHLLQALQAVEAAVKRFFFGHRQLLTTLVGSLEATGNRGLIGVEASDIVFTEPPYFPSLDAAKTFLGDLWQRELNKNCSLEQ